MGGKDPKPINGTITTATALMFMLLLLAVIFAFYNVNRYINVVVMGRKIAFENIILIHRAVLDACSGGVGGSKVAIFVPRGSTIIFDNDKVSIEGVDVKGLNKEAIKNYLNTYSRSESLKIDVSVGRDFISIYYKFGDVPIRFSYEEVHGGRGYTLTIICRGFYNVEVFATPSG